jgi:hypothetical protein
MRSKGRSRTNRNSHVIMSQPSSSDGEAERIGSVSCPSGIMVLLDGGLAWMWSHTRAPTLPEWSEIAAAANGAIDLAIRGPDAAAAGTAFERQYHPRFLYDIPRAAVEDLARSFESLVRERRLNASLERLPERVPHRRRIDNALVHGGGAGVVQFYGMWAVAAAGMPADRSLPVMGERMPPGADAGHWQRVWVEVREGQTVCTRRIGRVLVDEARLMVVDADALGAWDDSESLDGRADLVFWGRDARIVASEIGASRLASVGESFGWTDLPVGEALEREKVVWAARSSERRFAHDFRPHTHHWQVMRDVRASRTESGVLDLGGARLCMFMTTWGDGAFPVDADMDATGRILRLRIELGEEV